MKRRLVLLIFVLYFYIRPFNAGAVFAGEFFQASAVIQVASTVSDGKYSLEEIVRTARENEIKVVIMGERDAMQWDYGLWPLRKIIRKTVRSNSISLYGIKKYFQQIEKARNDNPDMIIIPAVECAPFYYWQGSFFKKNLAIMNWHKHMLLLGLKSIDDYKGIPSIANPAGLRLGFSPKSLLLLWPVIPLFIGVFLIKKNRYSCRDFKGKGLASRSRIWLIAAILSVSFSGLFLLNNFPYAYSKYDQYHGDRGIIPYQNLIDYAGSKEAMVFWAHPTAVNISSRGDIRIETREYSSDLLSSYDYDGFSVFYDGYDNIASVNGIWDKLLNEYCLGKRRNPVWAISGLGYDQTGEFSEALKDLKTVLLMAEFNPDGVYEAIRNGRNYTVMGKTTLRLEDFSVSDSLDESLSACMGQEAVIKGSALIHIKGYSLNPNELFNIRLIKAGRLLREFEASGVFDINYQDPDSIAAPKTYYRLEIRTRDGILVANPVFVSMDGVRPQP